ncbi:MAG: alpha/beta hydrolase-fold protein [Myxococcota bacterium]
MPRSSAVERFSVPNPRGGTAACTAVVPTAPAEPLPACLFLYGGGGSAETLVQMRPLIERWWASDAVAPMVFASAEVGSMSFYLDDDVAQTSWEQVVAEALLDEVRARLPVRRDPASTGLLGISMGGYGALKIALARPGRFGAVAAVQPMLEPARYADQAPLRNRFQFPPDAPVRLMGTERDPDLYAADSPITRAIENAEALRREGPEIYLEVGDRDVFNAHDGTELLHRVLWSLDIGHEYHLVHGADHGGPTLPPRLREAAAWIGNRLSPPPRLGMSPDEEAWVRWLDDGLKGPQPPAISPTSPIFVRWLRAMTEAARTEAAAADPTMQRRYGRLPSLSSLGLDDEG